MDKVKAAIFSSLGSRVPGARVLDLFAGSGALGIEALSRGAASAVFVDQYQPAAESIRANLARVRLAGEVVRADVHAWVRHAQGVFDIIFADPPYMKRSMQPGAADHAERLLQSEELPRLLDTEGVLILEKDPARPLPACQSWQVVRAKSYGKTEVLTLVHA